MSVIEGLPGLLEDSGQSGLSELRELLSEFVDGAGVVGRVIDQQRLSPRVHRLQFDIDGRFHSVIVKRLQPHIAQRVQLVGKRWLPAVGLERTGPPLLAAVAERGGSCVWHLYADLGDWALDPIEPEPARVQAVVKLVAKIHTRFAEHPLLAECRLHGGDLGIYFNTSNVRDAIHGLEALKVLEVERSAERVRHRLLQRLHKLWDEEPYRARLQAELGGCETLLHGDLWTTNTFVSPADDGFQARLIDWDHVAVGPTCYDLSTFLLRFPAEHRPWILEQYRESVAHAGWRLPGTRDLNVLFDTAERSRYANRVIWAALALLDDEKWGFAELEEIEGWFEALQPVLSE